MIYTGLGRVGEIADVKANSGADVAEVYGGIGESNPIFYSRKTLTGASPLTFKGLGQPLKDYHIFGETVQNGTPSPDYPVDVHGCGEWSESILDLNREYYNGFTLDTTKWMKGASSTKYGGDAYLVDASITDGKIIVNSKNAGYGVSVFIPAKPNTKYSIYWICNKTTEQGHEQISVSSRDSNGNATGVKSFHDPSVYVTESNAKYLNVVFRCRPSYGEVEYSDILVCESDAVVPYGYKIPITIGNVTTPIYIGSDPLYRSGDYADEIDFANQQIIRRVDPTSMQPYVTPITSAITVPQLTAAVGDNTLTVDTTVKPSAVSITGHIKPTGYGQLVDVNGVKILDKDNVPIYVHGQQ